MPSEVSGARKETFGDDSDDRLKWVQLRIGKDHEMVASFLNQYGRMRGVGTGTKSSHQIYYRVSEDMCRGLVCAQSFICQLSASCTGIGERKAKDTCLDSTVFRGGKCTHAATRPPPILAAKRRPVLPIGK
jgi:hypothetical protein